MAIYSSPEEMKRPESRTAARWACLLILTAFLALLCFLQSEEAANQLVVLQNVVTKNVSIRGNANKTASFETYGNTEDELDWLEEEDAADDDWLDEEDDADKQSKQPEKNPDESEKKGLVKVVVSPDEDDSNKADKPVPEKNPDESEKKSLTKVVVSPDGNGGNKADAVSGGTANQDANPYAKEKPNDCSATCSSRQQQHKKRWGGDLLNISDIKRLGQQAYDRFIAQLKLDYGEENFGKIFEKDGKARGRSAFLPANVEDGISLKRFKRKLKIKVLSAQASVQTELNSIGGCDCKVGSKQSNRRRLESETPDNDIPPFPSHYERLVWATGGHSSAAAHGNLFNESYTAVLENALSGIFGAIGIEFEGRNYAMGGTAGAPEIALCEEAVMGTDVDVLSWDYGMTDGRLWDRKGMYANRAGLNPGRPAIIDMFSGDRFADRRALELRKVDERGLTAFYMNPGAIKEMQEGIPDTFGLTSAQIDAMPRMVRHFKCQDALEKGDPTCGVQKYDNDVVCPKRKKMASWHPGWKLHALWGNIAAQFMSEMLLEAITELGSTSDPDRILRDLRLEEDLDYKKFVDSDLPQPDKGFLKLIGSDLSNETDAVSIFFRSPSICHTARLPAQTRYLGILTESDETGVKDYYKGIPRKEADGLVYDKDNLPMPLVFDENERQSCEYELNRDYKDYFFASDRMGWTTLTFPNKQEQVAYGRRDSEKYRGLIVLCLKGCEWGKCPAGAMQNESIEKGQVKFEINGKPVVNITNFDSCGALRGDHGHFWQPNANGRYVLRTKVLGDGSQLSFLRISSLILL